VGCGGDGLKMGSGKNWLPAGGIVWGAWLNGEGVAALKTPSFEDVLARFGGHSGSKTVGLLVFSFVGLPGAFHESEV